MPTCFGFMKGSSKSGAEKRNEGLWDKLTWVKEMENGVHLYSALVYSALVYSVSLKRQIRVVVLRRKEGMCVLFSTCCEQEAQEVYRFYSLRFQTERTGGIEFLFGDAKTHLGLEHCQSRQEKKLDFHFNFVFLLLNLARYELWGRSVLSVGDLKTAYFNRNWLQNIFIKLEMDAELIKKHPNYPLLEEWGRIAA
jgi:hypothetical protein